jgi:hypothetical protein
MVLPARFEERTLDRIVIDDERSFRHVGLYADLKAALLRSSYKFRILPPTPTTRWDRALFLNLTFWTNEGGDVLVDEHIPADVVAHVAWHHLAARACSGKGGLSGPSTAEMLFLGESIASGFDLYLVGRLLGHAPKSSFLETQVPAMAESASAAGMSDDAFEVLLEGVTADPERAFEDLRQLLFDASVALVACSSAEEARAVLEGFDRHRFGALLHHYELSNWVLYARAYAREADGPDLEVRRIDGALREADVALDWLAREWLAVGRKPEA